MNQVLRFISLVTATLWAYWQKIAAVETRANTAAGDATNALNTANTALGDAAIALQAAQSAESAANQYTQGAIQNLHLTAYKPALYVDISGTNAATTLSEIEGTVPNDGNGNYTEGNYYLIPDIVDGVNSVTFTRSGNTYTVTDDDVIVVIVNSSNAITDFSIRKNNNVTRLVRLENTRATITSVEAVEAKVDALDDKFSDGMDAIASTNSDFATMWDAIKTQYPA